MTHPTDAAIAQAFRDWAERLIHKTPEQCTEAAEYGAIVREYVYNRARELDAAKISDDDLPGMWSKSDFTGGDPDERSHAERNGLTETQKVERDAYLYGTGFMRDGKHIPAQEVMVMTTPPAQAAEAVERVAMAIGEADDEEHPYTWEGLVSEGLADRYRMLARAAIAAMQAGEG